MTDYPKSVFKHSCVSVEDGIVTLGGYTDESGYLKEAYLLRDDTWSLAGMLKEVQKTYFRKLILDSSSLDSQPL